MARSRIIKPGLYTNEMLVQLPFATRYLFAGLPCFADRAGRLEDKPAKIKMQMFPADNLSMEAMLCELEGAGFIIRYRVLTEGYIQIVNFNKHQKPHAKEAASVIPACEEDTPLGGAGPVLGSGQPLPGHDPAALVLATSSCSSSLPKHLTKEKSRNDGFKETPAQRRQRIRHNALNSLTEDKGAERP